LTHASSIRNKLDAFQTLKQRIHCARCFCSPIVRAFTHSTHFIVQVLCAKWQIKKLLLAKAADVDVVRNKWGTTTDRTAGSVPTSQ